MQLFLHVVFGISDHALHHFAADGAGLTGSQVSVVALLQVYVQGVRNFHLERVHRLLGLGNENVVLNMRVHKPVYEWELIGINARKASKR